MAEEKIVKFSKIEKKWQKKWEDKKVFEVKERKGTKKCYVLEMYPYPSGSGLHMGHALNYTIGDIYARFKRMQGFNVLHPMGFDSFGLPAENAAIAAKSHPKKFTEDAVKNYIKQMKNLGLSYDWSREIESHKPEYYKWDQWIFLKMFEKGLAYRKKAPVNFCPKCNSVLANEQVVNGKCWRHEDCDVQVKQLEQWFFKTTAYANELYEGLDKLEGWPETIKTLQRNWIGKSEGAEIDFEINDRMWKVFTTRADTLFGVTFLVVSSQHPDLLELVADNQMKEALAFLKKIKSVKEEDLEKMDKQGVFTGSYAIHPLTKEKIPIWTGNFVVADYGSGIVMGVPAHDQRDFEFAKKYGLKIKEVIQPEQKKLSNSMKDVFTDYGILVNSEAFNGLFSDEGKEHIIKALGFKGKGRKAVKFRLKDWLISRQRFWGTPIPIIYCDSCGIVPVPEKDLPVILPDDVRFSGVENPLADYRKFVEVDCPKCKSLGRRETDTMDTFVNSSWYFLRYLDSRNKKEIFDKEKAKYWMPVDVYIGGREHACLHLIYFRFYTKFLRDSGLLKVDEPALRLFNQGTLHASDGRKMSKSYGNIIVPEAVSEKYGIDTARMFLVSVASPDKDINWSDEGAEGSLRFLSKVVNFVKNFKNRKITALQESRLNRAIRDYSRDLENFRYNFAVIKLRELFGYLEEGCDKKSIEIFIKLLSPICPHIAEELWEILGGKGFVSLEKWPEFNEKKIDDKLEETEKQKEKVIEDIKNIIRIISEKRKKEPKKAYIYALPNEVKNYDAELIGMKTNLKAQIFAVNDKKKYDPEGKAGKAKPGKPGIYVE